MKKSRERCSLFSSSGREKFSLEILSNSYAFSLIFSFGFFFLFRSGNVREYHHIYQCLKIDGPWFLKLTSTFSPSCLDSLAAHATRRWTAFSQMIFFHHIIEQAQWLKTPKIGSIRPIFGVNFDGFSSSKCMRWSTIFSWWWDPCQKYCLFNFPQ